MFNLGWLVVGWALTLGFMPDNLQQIQTKEQYTVHSKSLEYLATKSDLSEIDTSFCLFQNIELNATFFNSLKVYTEIDTYDRKSEDSMWFTPFYTEYIFGINYTHKFAQIGFEHNCGHPVTSTPFTQMEEYAYYGQNKTKVFIKIGNNF